MFLLGADASRVGRFEHGSACIATSLVSTPSVAGSLEGPPCSLFRRALGHGCPYLFGVVESMPEVCVAPQAMTTEEMTLFQPDAIDVADAFAEVFPPYLLVPIPL